MLPRGLGHLADQASFLARNPYLFIFLNTFKYVSAHEIIKKDLHLDPFKLKMKF